MNIAIRLNEAMDQGNGRERLSQTELSARSGVPQPTIARILKGAGKRGPETATLIALSKALGVEFMWLQQGVQPKYPGSKVSAEPEMAKTVASVPEKQPEFKRHWLSQEEADHLADFRSLTPANQRQLRSVTKGMKRDKVTGVVDKL